MTRLDEMLNIYFETFNENYPVMITGGKSSDEIIADIKRCIENGEPAKKPVYEDDADY